MCRHRYYRTESPCMEDRFTKIKRCTNRLACFPFPFLRLDTFSFVLFDGVAALRFLPRKTSVSTVVLIGPLQLRSEQLQTLHDVDHCPQIKMSVYTTN
jgi:hypothetical protein